MDRERRKLIEAIKTFLVQLRLISDTDLSIEELLVVLTTEANEEYDVLEQWMLRRELIRKTRSGELQWETHSEYPDVYICHLDAPYRLRLVDSGGDLLQLDDAKYPHGNSDTVFVYADDKLLQVVKKALAGKYPTVIDHVRTMI